MGRRLVAGVFHFVESSEDATLWQRGRQWDWWSGVIQVAVTSYCTSRHTYTGITTVVLPI